MSGDTSTTPSKCNSCKEDLNQGSTKCQHCGTSQGNGRYINIFSLYAGALIALVSLVTIGVGFFKSLIENDSAKIVAYVSDFDATKINISASNLGKKPGLLYDIKLSHPDAINCKKGTNTNSENLKFSATVIESSKTIAIPVESNVAYGAFANFVPEALSDQKSKKQLEGFEVCSITYAYLDYDGTHKSDTSKFHCNPQGKCK
ncbi:hypothetical protein [Agarivorans sp. Toyoura001]|uniref:hypothetical protein n=1 Tax=Agarivorans sp. Toyoura001 TaxID=2283141 RepID=UPI0010F52591|nr:hypothetical protein [Agarivorans sp. Toyoura001]